MSGGTAAPGRECAPAPEAMPERTGRIRKALSGFYYVEIRADPDTGEEHGAGVDPDAGKGRQTGKGIQTGKGMEPGGRLIACRARGRFRKDGISPVVGDWVSIQCLADGTGYLREILPRKNRFTRPAVANIDQLAIIASAAIPRTDPFLIDRMSAVAALKNCRVLLILNKCDLDPADGLYRLYRRAGILTVRVSAATGAGLETLREYLTGQFTAFTGNSGVGKSSILNALCPAFALQTGSISDALGRGRHTTRHVEIFTLPFGAEAVDTPGFSSFEAEDLNRDLKEHLPETFPEFASYVDGCRFAGCSHTKEKGCRVLEAVRRGEIEPSRHRSYLRLYEELKPLKDWEPPKRRNL